MPDAFAEALIKAERYPDAVQLIAHELPKRQGVFWAITCIRQSGEARRSGSRSGFEIG